MEKQGLVLGSCAIMIVLGHLDGEKKKKFQNVRLDEFSSSWMGLVFGHLYGLHFFDVLGIATFFPYKCSS